jgi:UDP-3-O-[3-hydroxymyristoyl] glucosamine N-acyltransferase
MEDRMTDHELGPDRFFELEGTEYRDLMPRGKPAWHVLGVLKKSLEDLIEPNLAGVPLSGGMVTSTVVLTPGGVMSDGFEIAEWEASKGKLRVLAGGSPIEGASVISAGAFLAGGPVQIREGSLVETGAFIRGPAWIGPESEVRQGAYVRGTALVGKGCVVGHATEVKNAVFLDGAKAGHFAYVGDSILGFGVNLGAGTKLANLKIIEGTITLRTGDGVIDTGRRKLGAIIGDGSETGCNSVTSPGALLGPKSMVYPNTTVPPGVHLGKRLFRTRFSRGER